MKKIISRCINLQVLDIGYKKGREEKKGSKHSDAVTQSFTEIFLLILPGTTQKIFLESLKSSWSEPRCFSGAWDGAWGSGSEVLSRLYSEQQI